MNRILILALILLATMATAVLGATDKPPLTVVAGYLWEDPKIDGRADMVVADLPQYTLSPIGTVPPAAGPIEAHYRVGYTAGYLYFYVEVTGKTLVYRDRGYQNGDGFVVVLASRGASPDSSRQFYVLGFTPQKDSTNPSRRAMMWYHDVDLSRKPVKGAVLAAAELGDKIAFEATIPWSELYPYHPWLSTGLGLNLCVTRGIGESDKVSLIALPDENIGSEQSPRLSLPLQFAPPSSGALRVASVLFRNNFKAGFADSAVVAYIGDSATTEDMTITIASNRGNAPGIRQFPLTGTGKLETLTVGLPTLMLLPNDYDISWTAGPDSGHTTFTILPPYDLEKLKAELRTMGTALSPASVTTLNFILSEIQKEHGALQEKKPATRLRKLLQQFDDLILNARGGIEKLAHQSGVIRRAFQSKIDNTLQPYTVQVPANLDSTKKYPLVVFLHGSGEDDQRMLPSALFADSSFVLAPYGRGTSTMYSSDHAEEDIMEALADVIANYPIDPKRVIISGFSMGGYGAYRTFADHPESFKAIAVFSGHPNLPNALSGATKYPNFLNPASLAPFAKRAMFIFHGGQDRNCPVEVTQQAIEKLKAAGAEVTFAFEPEAGHQQPNPETIAKFRAWLTNATRP